MKSLMNTLKLTKRLKNISINQIITLNFLTLKIKNKNLS